MVMIVKLGLKGDSYSELNFLFLLPFQCFSLDSLYIFQKNLSCMRVTQWL